MSRSDSVAVLATLEARPHVPKPDPILTVRGLQRRFGALRAVDIEHLEVQRGAITALIGPNGAGKTTFFNVITGFQRADHGEWHFDDVELTGRPAHRIAQQGMVRTFQLTKALGRMSVLDNMRLAAKDNPGERLRSSVFSVRWKDREVEIDERARDLLERFDLARVADDYAATLSGGQRKLLEMARALMVGPRFLLLDEPTAGVNPALKQSILEHVRELCDEGMSVLYVEHDMDVVMGISDWVVCMDVGSVIAEGPPSSIVANDAVIDAYLGARRGGSE